MASTSSGRLLMTDMKGREQSGLTNKFRCRYFVVHFLSIIILVHVYTCTYNHLNQLYFSHPFHVQLTPPPRKLLGLCIAINLYIVWHTALMS